MSQPAHSPSTTQNVPEEVQSSEPQPSAHPPARVPRSHINAMVVDSFKALSLKAKLKVCKDIKEQNDARLEKTRLNTLDPANHPQPRSETASLFSLDDGDLNKLKRPSFALIFRNVMPTYIANWLFEHNIPDATDSKCDSEDNEDSRIAKRRCMDGDTLKPHAVDISADLEFTQLFYEMAHPWQQFKTLLGGFFDRWKPT
jgi:hypothetical protein